MISPRQAARGASAHGACSSTERHGLIEDAVVVRVADLRRLGAFDSGDMPWNTPEWWRAGRVAGHLQFRVHADCHDRGRVLHLWSVSASTSPRALRETIELTFTLPHLGGVRWWARCSCGRRVATLFCTPSEMRFRCRRCTGLTYASQREKAAARLLRRAEKLRTRLGQGGLWPIAFARGSTRPKWMRHRTYARLYSAVEHLDEQLVVHAAAVIAASL